MIHGHHLDTDPDRTRPDPGFGMTGLSPGLKTALLTSMALVGFASNSVLARLALQEPAIDPASFASLRLASGALALWMMASAMRRGQRSSPADWIGAVMLFLYAVCFSFAYRFLGVGTGALILFGAVQLTMLGAGLRAHEPFRPLFWFGFTLSMSGLVYLVSPGLTAPAPFSAALMAVAGIAWGVYTLRGRGIADPLGATAGNFIRAVPPALLMSLLFRGDFHATPAGVALAIASGALASGFFYVLWYTALRGLGATRAAMVQLAVPVIAAFGGVGLLSEEITWRLLLASTATLGGIALAFIRRRAAVGNQRAIRDAGCARAGAAIR